MQKAVAADMVGIGVRVIYRGQMPAVFVKQTAYLSARLLVVAAVDKADVGVAESDKTYLSRTLDIIALL